MNTVRHRAFATSTIATMLLLASLAIPPYSAAQSDSSVWLAASGKVDITPEAPMWMAGYAARTKPAEGTLTPLFAKVLALQDTATGKPAVLVTLDLVGIDRELAGEISHALMEAFKIDRDGIAICTSHTHSGPALWRNLAPLHYLLMDDEHKERIRAYTESLAPRIVALAKSVHSSMHPVRLSWGNGSADFAVNRRENSEALVPEKRRDGSIVGPAQHDVPVLAVHDLDGTLQTIVFGYACHSTVLDQYQWCGDYPGFAQQALETSHPEAIAMFWAGCGADQNPIPRRSVELAKHYGARLATAVDKVLLTTTLRPLDSALHTRFDKIPLDYAAIPTKEQLQADTASDNRYTAARATMLLEQLDRDGALPSSYPFPVGHWSLGTEDPVDFVFLGGETVIDYAIRLKKELHGTRTWVASYSNDVMAYIPSERVLAEGGYEGGAATVYYGLPAPWAPGLEEKIIAAATKPPQTNKVANTSIGHKIRIAPDGKSFVLNGERFRIWGVNYDHNEHASTDGVTGSQLIEEYWHDDWQQVADDFAEIRALGANVVRVHLQFNQFMSTATEPNQKSLARLRDLLELAKNTGLYLDLTGLGCYRKADVPDWYDALDESARWQSQAAFWGAIARTCANHPAVFCYDLMNEPILDGGEGEGWLPGEPLGGYHFVQRITRDNAGRKGGSIAKAWIDTLVSAIREYDTDTLTTVGVIPWATVFPGAKPLFHDPDASKGLDFVSVHFYPKTGEIDKALTALKVYDIGKPVVIEEMFPLSCSSDDLLDFVNRSATECGTDGWISFYWGKTATELRADPDGGISAAIKAEWFDRFAKAAEAATGTAPAQ